MAGSSMNKDLIWRHALFGGLTASVFATLGWLAWLAVHAYQENRAVLLAPLIGAVLGIILHWLAEYRHTAVRERGHQPAGESAGPASELSPDASTARLIGPINWVAAARIGALAATLLFVVCEEILGDLMAHFAVPFVASLATLFPVGALFSVAYQAENRADSFISRCLAGLLLGLITGVVVSVIYIIMRLGFEFTHLKAWNMMVALCAWWMLMGLGIALMHGGPGHPRRWAPVAGTLLALSFVVLTSVPLSFAPRSGWPGALFRGLGALVDRMLASPDLPAEFWADAERQLIISERKDPRRSFAVWGWGNRLAQACGCEEAQLEKASAALPYLGLYDPDLSLGFDLGDFRSRHLFNLPQSAPASPIATQPSLLSDLPTTRPWRSFLTTQPGLFSPATRPSLLAPSTQPLFLPPATQPSWRARSLLLSGRLPALETQPVKPPATRPFLFLPTTRPFAFPLTTQPFAGAPATRPYLFWPSTQPGSPGLLLPYGLKIPEKNMLDELEKRRRVLQGLYLPPDPVKERHRSLCQQLRLEFNSGLIRSWFVMVLFSIGLAVAPAVEIRLRPRDYPSSRTRRNDRILWAATIFLIVLATALARWHQRHDETSHPPEAHPPTPTDTRPGM